MPYIDKLTKHAAGLQRGGIYEATIQHDNDCPFLLGVGPCICRPDIEIQQMNRAQRRQRARRRS